MICGDFDRLWNELLDARGEESPAVERALDEHAEACPACRSMGLKYQALRQAIGALGPPPAPPTDFARRFFEAREIDAATAGLRAIRLRAVARVAAAAALLATCLLTLRAGLSSRPRPAGPPPPIAAPRPLTDALADATRATWDLALAASGPAARVGSQVLGAAPRPAAPALSVSTGPASEVLQRVGDRINAGVRPLSGSARHAFGFLLDPALGDPKPEPGPRDGA